MKGFGLVGRTPWSAADALVGLCERVREAGQGAGCGPGGPPHQKATARFEGIFEGVSTPQLEGRATKAKTPARRK
jgi:hypothetical protein